MQNQQYPPQQGWQQPPPNQYAPPGQAPYGQAPPQQWGAPPPPQQYNAPPGQYPPPGQPPYGAPPPGQYGAPPPSQYGAPPPGQTPYGGPPPAGQFGPPTQPSLGYGPIQTANIDVSQDIEGIRKAMKGFGTNEKKLIEIMAKRDPIQMNTIRTQYDQRLMRNLIKDLESETSGYFEKGLVAIARGPLIGDCFALMEAMKGLGTKEAVLDDVLVGRSNADINAIKAEYQRLFNKSLEGDLKGDLSAGTEQMYMMIINARRNEDSAPVIPQEIERVITDLQNGMGNMISKNATQVCQILFSKNDAQLRAICQAYQTRFHKSLESVVKSKFSGHMEDALLLLLARANNRAKAEAERLEDAMKGLGTKDELLVQRVVRNHWDRNHMAAVRQAFKQAYGRDLVDRIKGETRGDYERLMVGCVQ